jgi:hypothetical protein
MRHLGIVASSAPQASAPLITINSVTNFNQDRATLNATVTPNGATTSVKFQISTNNSTWTDVTTITGLTGNSQSTYYNHTGLSNGTLYYIRAIATNSAGESTSSSTSFTTWSLQVYERTTSGGTTFTIPTITPTGGSAVAASVYDVIMFGGGGGNQFGGGGGGGYVSADSVSMTGSRSITTSVGGGGSGGDGFNSTATSGGSTTLSGDLTTQTAAGGVAGNMTIDARTGSSGNGNVGGFNRYYILPPGGKNDPSWAGYGGGGGAGGAGADGFAGPIGGGSYNGNGGNGGTGVSITRGGVTVTGGAGGGGQGSTNNGSNGSNGTYGSGGGYNGNFNAGQSGYIRFRYYAASALA